MLVLAGEGASFLFAGDCDVIVAVAFLIAAAAENVLYEMRNPIENIFSYN